MTSLLIGIPLLFLTVAIGYLTILALAALRARPESFPSAIPEVRFAIVVPAHDEEKGLSSTLASLRSIDYPGHLLQIVVVADNCSDRTAQVALADGVRCIVRSDVSRRGKGYALAFAFDELLCEDFDAFVVVDADNVVSPNFLKAMSVRLKQGQTVIQSKNIVRNPLENALTWMLAVGNAIENVLYSSGKYHLGLSSPLRGTGMCFSREVLVRFPWKANSVVEDTEYGLLLMENGVRIFFSSESEVASDAPSSIDMLLAQRIRWASGNMQLAKKSALMLIYRGITAARIELLDLGWSMLIRSKPLLFALSFSIFVWSILVSRMVFWSSSVFLLWVLYFCAGIHAAGFSRQSARLTLLAPLYLTWLVGIALCGLFGYRRRQWVRTGRE